MAILKFQNPANNYTENYNDTLSPIWCLLFGPLYWLARGNLFHAIISAGLAFVTVGISQLGYALFANGINLKAYRRKGWVELENDIEPNNQKPDIQTVKKTEKPKTRVGFILTIILIFIIFPFIVGMILKAPQIIDEAKEREQQTTDTSSAIEAQTEAVKPVNPNAAPQKLPSQITANPKDKIAEYAVRPITKSGYPTTYKTWGASKIKHINSLQPKAALKIASSPDCNRLEMLGLSLDRSSPPNKIVFFADCTNGQRFYVSEAEIKASGAVKSKNDKLASIKDKDAEQACIDQTKTMLHFPSSFDLKILSIEINRGMTGNIEVTFNFDAKNGLGNVLPQKARCVIDDEGLHPVEISNR